MGLDEKIEDVSGAWGPRYGSLDAWRGLACLLVVVHHAGLALKWAEARGSWSRWLTVWSLRRMNLGVVLFFVISGYCIAASADAAGRRGAGPWPFLGRRLWRIYPPYWVALLVFLAVILALDAAGLGRMYSGPRGVQLDPPSALNWSHWVGNLTLTETWRPHVFGSERNVYTGVAWSLCFEEQFYLVCFLALWLAPTRLAAALGAATVGIVGLRLYAWGAGRTDALSGTFPLLWHQFAVGLAVYYRLNLARGPASRRLVDLGLAGLLAACLLAGERETATASAFGLTLIGLRRWDGLAENLAALAPLRACGRRCYSIYLAHLPLSVVGNQWLYEAGVTGFWPRALVTVPLATAAGVAAGWAFYAAIESRFVNPPRPGGRRSWSWAEARRGRVFSAT